MELNLMRLLAEYQEAGKEAALITVISCEGVNRCHTGSTLLVDGQGAVLASRIGNELIQQKAAEQGKICIERGLSRKAYINTEEGNVEVFVNAYCNQDHLIIVGAGTISLNLYKFVRVLGYKTTILDNRAEMLTKERFPESYKLLLGDIVDNLCSCDITESTSIVIATHHHEFDEKALRAVISSPARYIGVLGNQRRVAEYFKNLEPLTIPEELIRRVHSPIGLDLGGNKTAEIALAIMAEIQAVKYKRQGGFINTTHFISK